MDFYHRHVVPLLLYFSFRDDVVERRYFLSFINFLHQINLSNFNRRIKKKITEQTIILTTISLIREKAARAELLSWIVSLNMLLQAILMAAFTSSLQASGSN